jgi:hypothetical protein
MSLFRCVEKLKGVGGDWNNLNLYCIRGWWQYSVDIIGTAEGKKLPIKNIYSAQPFLFFSFTHDSGIKLYRENNT